jgi:Pyruvate/2-oxoacid:ferredoxin oxidoreductase delta subunit
MSKSVLKKEFQQRDVERMRNLMKGKHGDKTVVGIGYTKKEEFHSEGDIWEEDGRKWTIKNGVKQNVTKLDKAKESLHLPLFCPECNKMMKPHLDKRFWIMYNRCFNCQVDFEGEIRRQGLWEEYEKNIINSDIDFTIQEFQIWSDEVINEDESFITEDGDIQSWVGKGKQVLLQNRDETIKYLQSLKK